MINLVFINQFGRFENISGTIKSKLVFGGGEEPFLILAYWVGKLDLQVGGSHVCMNMTKNHFHSLHKWLTIGLGGIESYSSRWPWPLRSPKIRVSLF